MKTLTISSFVIIFFYSACSDKPNTVAPSKDSTAIAAGSTYEYRIDDQKLYDTIVHLDSLFFAAYNNCSVHTDFEKYGTFYADSIEFYHDKGGLMTSKKDIMDATQKNICGKVTRELVNGTIEVYPVPGYGAIEIGLHKFHNNTDSSGIPSHAGRFTVIWQRKNAGWKITRVISLH